MKSRKEKERIYDEKYSEIPRDYNERINYMINKYNINPKMMQDIIYRKRNMESNLISQSFTIILYEDPEGTPRPRFRFINKKNYMEAAITNPGFVHVYQPGAGEDHLHMHRLVENELVQLRRFVQTPCMVTIDSFFKTPSNYSREEIILAEYGLDWDIKKPDWDNIGKKYSDMYTNTIWLDDNMVISGTVNKFYSILPRVEIELHYLNVAPNKKQYDTILHKKDFKEDYPIDYLDNKGNLIYKSMEDNNNDKQ